MFQPGQPAKQAMQFEFRGTATQYFGIWIVNLLLIIITLGIYTAWAKVRTKRYFYGNTLLDGSPFDYLASPITILKGWVIAVLVLIAYNILTNVFPITSLLLLPLLLIALPWVIVRAMRFRARNSAWRNIRFGFKNAYGEAFRVFVGVQLLMVLTLGLLLPYYYYAISRFMVNNSGYGTTAFRFHASARDFYRIFMKPALAMLVVMIALVAISYPTLKAYYDQYLVAAEAAQAAQQDDMSHEDEDMGDDAYVLDEAASPEDEMILAEDNNPAYQDQVMSGEPGDLQSDAYYEDQQARMLEQAMQDLADANAGLANTDDMENTGFEDLYTGSDMTDMEGSGDEVFEAEVTDEQMNEQLQTDAAAADETVPDSVRYAAAGIGFSFMLGLFLFYLVFMAYIQSRVWNLFYNNSELAGHRFRSTVRARDIIWLYASNMIVISLTFGLMIPWAKIRMARYRASKLLFLPAGDLDSFMQAQQDKINALGEEMGDAFDLDIGL